MKNIFFPFHLVELSPWPLFVGISTCGLMSSLVSWFKFGGGCLWLFISLVVLFLFSLFWWRDVGREALMQGSHNIEVQRGLKLGMGLFIFSEVLFFSAFFWTFFHSSLAPSVEIGLVWPPIGVFPLNPFQVPLLNTVVLLSSGATVTWSHHSLLTNKNSGVSLLMTIFLGGFFTVLQWFEYKEASFSLGDSVYGSTFFVSTGFHGLHVLVGSSMLLYCFFRMLMNHFSFNHHVGFEMSIWYWHFVDVVWLFLFSMVYWWGC